MQPLISREDTARFNINLHEQAHEDAHEQQQSQKQHSQQQQQHPHTKLNLPYPPSSGVVESSYANANAKNLRRRCYGRMSPAMAAASCFMILCTAVVSVSAFTVTNRYYSGGSSSSCSSSSSQYRSHVTVLLHSTKQEEQATTKTSSLPSASKITPYKPGSNRPFKRSAAGYPRKELMYDAAEEWKRVQELRQDMYYSLGLQQKQENPQQLQQGTNGDVVEPVEGPTTVSAPSIPSNNKLDDVIEPVKKKRRGRPPGRKNNVKARADRKSNSRSTTDTILKSAIQKRRKMESMVTAADEPKQTGKKRGRKPGSKNKPKTIGDEQKGIKSSQEQQQNSNSSISPENDMASKTSQLQTNTRRMSVNSEALQKYYNSDLLTRDEEKIFGSRVQYLMKCEEVHEGLMLNLGRMPTFKEWSSACGYTNACRSDDDRFSVPAEEEEKKLKALRPVSETSPLETADMDDTKEYDKSMPIFVGSVTAGTGVGRGKGRAKKVPRQSLDEIVQEGKDQNLTRVINDLAAESGRCSEDSKGRGSPEDFLQDLVVARDAKKTMVRSNMRLVISIARRYQKVGVNLQDLVQEGSLGLMRATEKYDPSRGFKFSTYASWWIQQAVFRAIAYHSRTIRLPVHIHNLLNRARKVRSELQAELGRAPLDREIAEKLEMPPEKLTKILLMTRQSVSLEQPRFKQNPKDFNHESDMVIGEAIDSNRVGEISESPENMVDNDLFHADLEEMLMILGEDERTVMRLRYGMVDGMTRTVSIVSEIMNKPKSWVRSQECRALRKLRRPWYEKKLKEHQNSLTS